MSRRSRISRRTVLRGLGTALALPLLDGMMPRLVRGATAQAAANTVVPNRMAFLYVPNGKTMQDWTPAAEGADFVLEKTLEPLAPHKNDLLVLSGLTADKARANGDGGGDHARAQAAFLTGCQPKKTGGADIRVGVSVDQLAAQKVGTQTRFPSLELGCDAVSQTGACDTGYSCAYQANFAWRAESTPAMKEIDPKQVFERLFTNKVSDEEGLARRRREKGNHSVLDFVLDDAQRLQTKLGAHDKRKIDEYLSSVRELEQRANNMQRAPAKIPNYPEPKGIPSDYQEHMRLMCDMIVLAFQTDTTRIATFVLAHDGSNRSYASLGVPEGHHDLSHHGGNQEKQAKIAKINHFHVEQLAYLLEKLKGVKEADGTLLDHSMIVYGSGISDGNRHNHNDLPIVLAGKGRGTIATGRHIRYPEETPLTNLWLSMLDRMDCGSGVDHLGDSKGRLDKLTV